jgi:hypothetical protein
LAAYNRLNFQRYGRRGRAYAKSMRAHLTFLAMVLTTASVAACSAAPAQPRTAAGRTTSPSLLSLSCSDSIGQQSGEHQTVVGGVTGLVLPDSDDPAGLFPVRASDGRGYFVYKAMLAVSAAAAPFATVSITNPADATLLYGSATHVGDLVSTSASQGLVAASRREVRLPVCGPRFTGYVGGIVVTKPACVTFEVTSPGLKPATVTVPIGPATCSPQSS